MYGKAVLDHLTNPRNVGILDNPDGYNRQESSSCGDLVEVYLKIQDGKIVDIKQRTFGCAAAIAASSLTSELVRGKEVDSVRSLSVQTIVEKLALPPVKRQCAALALRALVAALEDYDTRSLH